LPSSIIKSTKVRLILFIIVVVYVSQDKVNKLTENELLHILESKRTVIMEEQKAIFI